MLLNVIEFQQVVGKQFILYPLPVLLMNLIEAIIKTVAIIKMKYCLIVGMPYLAHHSG
jgi:hypothetical protein